MIAFWFSADGNYSAVELNDKAIAKLREIKRLF
jgi:hypothetical protein